MGHMYRWGPNAPPAQRVALPFTEGRVGSPTEGMLRARSRNHGRQESRRASGEPDPSMQGLPACLLARVLAFRDSSSLSG
jgi:hypothetical protein